MGKKQTKTWYKRNLLRNNSQEVRIIHKHKANGAKKLRKTIENRGYILMDNLL